MTSKLLQTIRATLTPTVAPCEKGTGTRYVWRDGDASLCVETYPRIRARISAHFTRFRGGAGLNINPIVGAFVGVAHTPREWLDGAEWFNDPKEAATTEETSAAVSIDGAEWSWRGNVAEIRRALKAAKSSGKPLPNTLRFGVVRWNNVLLGPTVTRTLKTRRSVKLKLPEGTYAAVGHRVLTFGAYEVYPRLGGISDNVVTIEVEHGVAMPHKDKAGKVYEALEYRFATSGGDLQTGTILKCAKHITETIARRRAEVGGEGWKPALRVRRKADADKARPFHFGATTTPAADDVPVAWERRNPMTGVWSDFGTMAMKDLPEGSHVEVQMGAAAMAMVGMGAVAVLAGALFTPAMRGALARSV